MTKTYLALPWLQNMLGLGSAIMASAIAVLITAIAGLGVWADRFGAPRLWGRAR